MGGLSDVQLRRAKPEDKPYRLRDTGGLYLDIRPSGVRVWRCRFKIKGKEGVFTIGDYPGVSLSAARAERDRIKTLTRQGINPNEAKAIEKQMAEAEAANTFEIVAREHFLNKQSKWSDTYAHQYLTVMEGDVFPYIGHIPARDIKPIDILQILKRMEARGAPTLAINARMWCSQVFRYAVTTLRADIDPAAMLKGSIEKPEVRHNPGLDVVNIKQIAADLEGFAGFRTTVIGIWLMLICFPRTVELRRARWDEFDFEARVWSLTPERMKKKRRHLVPLSDQAVDLLKELHTLTGGQQWLFPNNRRPYDCMTATTINRALERMGWKGELSGHGFRTTASTLLHEMGYRTEVVEKQLAHADANKNRAAYNHAEYLAERREMLQVWADWVWSLRGLFCLLRDPFIDQTLRPPR